MFWWKRDNASGDTFVKANEMEDRLLDKQQAAEKRQPEVTDVVAKLKLQAERNHFGEALVLSFGSRRGA